MEWIKNRVNELIKKHNTYNPYEIAEAENIIVLFEPLGFIDGYYNKFKKQKFIHINEAFNDHKRLFTCCHELGHAILHPNSNTPFLHQYIFYKIDKLEYQANIFAMELIISDPRVKKMLE